MAGRREPKEYRQQIANVEEWEDALKFKGVIVLEIFTSRFGPCDAIAPTIEHVVNTVDGAKQNVRWLQMNIAKVEDQKRKMLEEQKEQELELEKMRLRRERFVRMDGESGPQQAEKEEEEADLEEPRITLPVLGKFSGYKHPRPLWVFVKNKEVLHELHFADPPKLMALVRDMLAPPRPDGGKEEDEESKNEEHLEENEEHLEEKEEHLEEKEEHLEENEEDKAALETVQEEEAEDEGVEPVEAEVPKAEETEHVEEKAEEMPATVEQAGEVAEAEEKAENLPAKADAAETKTDA